MTVPVNRAGRVTAAPNAGPFDVDLVGRRFLEVTQKERNRLHLISDWFDDLTRRLPHP
jgi:hypothetical protein